MAWADAPSMLCESRLMAVMVAAEPEAEQEHAGKGELCGCQAYACAGECDGRAAECDGSEERTGNEQRAERGAYEGEQKEVAAAFILKMPAGEQDGQDRARQSDADARGQEAEVERDEREWRLRC